MELARTVGGLPILSTSGINMDLILILLNRFSPWFQTPSIFLAAYR